MKLKRLLCGISVGALLFVSACATDKTAVEDEAISRDPASATTEMVCSVQSASQTYNVIASGKIVKEARSDAEEQCKSVDPDAKSCSRATCKASAVEAAPESNLNHL
jgi:hypothetical protein